MKRVVSGGRIGAGCDQYGRDAAASSVSTAVAPLHIAFVLPNADARDCGEFGIIRAAIRQTDIERLRPFNITPAERCALALAAVVLLLQALDAGALLEYRRGLLVAQPWRLMSGHLVHINWMHAAINSIALVIVARLFAPELPALRQIAVLVVAAFVVGSGLAWFYPGILWYRGLSGILHALFFAGAIAWLVAGLRARPRRARAVIVPALLVIGGWIKVAMEQPAGGALPHADWLGAAVVPQAHLLGAACGSLLGLAFALARRGGRAQQQQ